MTHRFQRVKRPHIRITARDLAIVESTFRARYLTNQQIAQLLFSPGAFSSCKKRVRYLFDRGYLRKRATYVNEPDIYFLGLAGKRHIVRLGEYPSPIVDRIAGVRGGEGEGHYLMMRHELTLSQLYVNAALDCRQRGWTLHWENARMLELRKLGVQPDAYLRVGERGAFLEFTGVVPTGVELGGKVEGYTTLLEALEGRALVLWLTTSKAKLGQLWRGISQGPYPDYFLLGLIDEATQFLTRPMWRWSEAEHPVAFIAPQERVVYGVGGRAAPDPPSLG